MTEQQRRIVSVDDIATLKFDEAGHVIVVAQHAGTGDVLMVARADREAIDKTLTTGEMHYRSRTRGLWHKGATSGNTQRLVELFADCDGDTLLAIVQPAGPACHTGAATCFGASVLPDRVLPALDATIAERFGETRLASSYTQRLFNDRNLRLKKLGEEAAELVLACADEDKSRAVSEASDVIYHTLVALRALGAGLTDVEEELARRTTRRGES